MAISAYSQPYNANPDPNGEPWWIGGLPELTPEIQAELDAIPELVLTPASLQKVLPASVDNSKRVWFRPIFQQKDFSCGHASGVGYTFTYEVNRVRNLPSNNAQNQYPTHYTWNYFNLGENFGSGYQSAWYVIRDCGIPNVTTYGGGMWLYDAYEDSLKRWTVWMNGYDKYHSALHNRVLESTMSINVSTPMGLEKLKHWLNDHGEGAETGGLVVFSVYAHGDGLDYQDLPPESDETGKKIVTRWGSTGPHAMTIVGYNDNIKFDFDSSGTFTNPEGNMAQWEIGALKVANSAGTGWQDEGFVYMPYRLLALNSTLGGINSNTVYGIKVRETHTPRVTLRVKVGYPIRKYISFRGGVAEDPNATSPTRTQIYQAYGKLSPELTGGGGDFPMQGINNDPIEIELDVTSLLDGIIPAKFFLEVDNRVTSGHIDTVLSLNGFVHELTLVDYDTQNDIPIEVSYTGSSFPVPIVKNDTTILPISYDYIPSSITEMVSINREFILNKDVRVVDGGVLKVSNIGKLIIPSSKQIVVKTGSTLIINNCAHLEIFSGGQIIVEEGAILKISPNAILNAHEGQGAFTIHPNVIIPSGFVHPYNVVPPTYRILSGAQTWNSASYTMHRNLILEPSASLNLSNSTLSFTQGKGINIKTGASLTLNEGLLTNKLGCGSEGRWNGITVEGNPFAGQSREDQGNLTVNGTVISNATMAIMAHSGAVVVVNGATLWKNANAIEFAPYRFGNMPNQSVISNSTFIAPDYDPQIKNPTFIRLNRVSGIAINDNTFTNPNPGSTPIPLRGYGIYAVDADVAVTPRVTTNTFSGLFTAVHAIGTKDVPSFVADGLVIGNCFNGIHVSSYYSPVVSNCSIDLPPDTYEDKLPSGISILTEGDISVRGCVVNGEGEGYGLYLKTSSGRGLVQSNVFKRLNTGVYAAGALEYRNCIQLQCNQFLGNHLADIFVSERGIDEVQGTPDESASNLFLSTPQFNIYSNKIPITYYSFPGDYYPMVVDGYVRVIDANNLANCEGGQTIIKPRLESIALQEDSVQMATDYLFIMQDMGGTQALVSFIEGETNPIRVRNALLSRSPMLSDTVMVRAAADAVSLPNIMLTQVLTGNPQAAKSAEVLDALGNRENTMPPYFMEAILEAGNALSPIDEVKAEIAHRRASRDIAAGNLLSGFASDTLGKQYDSMAMLKDYHPDLIYRYIAAFSFLEQGLDEEALAQFNSMEEILVSPMQEQELDGVKAISNLIQGMESNGITYTTLDSLSRSAIEIVANSGSGLASTIANNILMVADTVPFLATEIAFGNEYSSAYQVYSNPYITIDTYPIESFVVVGYNLGVYHCNAPRMVVESENGSVKYIENLSKKQWEVLVEVNNWLPGLYKVKLLDKEIILAQTSFVVDGYEELNVDTKFPEATSLCPLVTVHPNPTEGMLSIEVNECPFNVDFSYEVISHSGVKLLAGTGNDRQNVTLADLPRGLYLVVVMVKGHKRYFSVMLK
jgi:hypothetical protein